MGPQVTAAILIFILLQKSSSPLLSLSLMTVDFDAQMQYFMIRVANFEPLYLKQFWVKINGIP